MRIGTFICYNHTEPVVHEGQHVCPRALIGTCNSLRCAGQVQELDKYFRCVMCGYVVDSTGIQPKHDDRAVYNSLKTQGLLDLDRFKRTSPSPIARFIEWVWTILSADAPQST